jgi:curved DNA-binding protein CbpA
MSDAAKSQSYYEVLGVARDADDRTIKKSYFALVRKYPPDTCPDEFKRIREAYEVLSNPVSRKDYDAVNEYDQYGEEISQRLKVATGAMDAADWRTAQRELLHVLGLKPDLHFARDLLGMAYLNAGTADQALAQFDQLVAAQPNNAVYHLHKGYAHSAQKQYGPAMNAYRQAQTLDDQDTRALVAMADCLSSQKQWEAALAELDKAIGLDGKVDFNDFVFFMRKVQIQLLRNRPDLAEVDLDQVFKILPDDPDTKKYVATRLASLAADLFAMKRSVDANRLLNRCKLLDPSRASMSFQFPSRTTVPIVTLPVKSQDWIATHGKEFASGKLQHGKWGGPIFLLIVAACTGLGVFANAFGATRLWDHSQQLWMFLWLTGAPLFLAWTIARVRRVAKSPYGKYTTIHPLHLMQVDLDKVTIWPLVNLHDVSLTHHHTNGVYQYTAVRMDFAGTVCNLTIRGQQASVDWANRLLGQRQRVLELMSMGLLDAEDGFDLVPPEQLGGSPKAAPVDKAAKDRATRFYLGAAGVGVLMAIVAIPYNKGAADREGWRMASIYRSIPEYRRYLDKFPSGNHHVEAQQGIDGLYEKAIASYKERAKDPDPKALDAMIGVIQGLQKAGTQQVKLVYTGGYDFSDIDKLDKKDVGDVIPADAAFTPSYNKTRESSITSSLKKAFGEILSHDVLDFDDGGYDYSYSYRRYDEPKKDSPVTFTVKYKVVPSGSLYESTTGEKKKMFGILIEWDFGIRFAGEKDDRYHLTTTSRPRKNIRYTTYDYENSDIVPYTKMAESAFDVFGSSLAASFGVTVPEPTEESSSSTYGSGGGYGGGGYGSGKRGKTKMSPEMQKALDDLIKKGVLKPDSKKLFDQ